MKVEWERTDSFLHAKVDELIEEAFRLGAEGIAALHTASAKVRAAEVVLESNPEHALAEMNTHYADLAAEWLKLFQERKRRGSN